MLTTMKVFVVLAVTILMIKSAMCAMTEAQVKSAGKMMRNVCQPKTKVTSAQVDAMHKGEFTDNPDLKCYMECVLRMAQMVKDNKINIESALTQLSNLPPSLSESAKASFNNCKGVIKSSDKCEAAYEFYKCIYDFSPSKLKGSSATQYYKYNSH